MREVRLVRIHQREDLATDSHISSAANTLQVKLYINEIPNL